MSSEVLKTQTTGSNKFNAQSIHPTVNNQSLTKMLVNREPMLTLTLVYGAAFLKILSSRVHASVRPSKKRLDNSAAVRTHLVRLHLTMQSIAC